jgi:molecular chaperone DnaJ
MNEILEQIFGRAGGVGTNFGGARPAGPSRGEDLTARVQLTLNEAVTGGDRLVSITRPGRCQNCDGRGELGKVGKCKTCGGSGRSRTGRGPLQFAGACPTCNGTGRAGEPCPECDGTGVEEETARLTVKIPPGVQTGSQVRLVGQGAAGTRGGPPGDLYIETEIVPHPLMRREGDDLYLDLPITVPEAMLGAEVRVPTFEGEVTVTIPAGSQSGRKMRLRGRGVPALKGGSRGDMYLLLKVMVPEDAGADARAVAEKLKGAYRSDVRSEVKI